MIGLLTAAVSAFLIGGVGLGWVASVNWKRSLAAPAQWRSISYLYGTAIILLCEAISALVTGDMAALLREWIITVICGLWTMGTHFSHSHSEAREQAAISAVRRQVPVSFPSPWAWAWAGVRQRWATWRRTRGGDAG